MKSYLYLLFPLLLLSGCADLSFGTKEPSSEVTEADILKILNANYKAADELIKQAEAQTVDSQGLDRSQPLIVGTVVNINALEESTLLGRMIAEQISGQFSRRGYKMIEIKFRDSVYVKQDVGELMLTREVKELAKSHKVQAVIVGTYTKAKKWTVINMRLIRPTDNVVLASYDYPVSASAISSTQR